MKGQSICRFAALMAGVILLIGDAIDSAFAQDLAQETNQHFALQNDWLSSQMAELSALPLEKLRIRLQEIEENIPRLARDAQEIQTDLRELRAKGYDSEPAKAVRAQIAELQQKLEQVVDELPEVKAKAEEAAQAKTQLFQNMQLRTSLMSLIAAAERKQAAESGKTQSEAGAE